MANRTHWGEINKEDDLEEEYESEDDDEQEDDEEFQGDDDVIGAHSSDGENHFEHLKAQIAADDGEFAVPQDLYDFGDKREGGDNVQPSYEDLKSGTSSLISGA